MSPVHYFVASIQSTMTIAQASTPQACQAPSPKNEHELTKATKDAIEQAHSAYRTLNPASHDAFLSSCKHLPGGNTRTVLHANPFPLTFASGNGCTLTSLDGNTYIDFLGEFTAGIYGHNDPAIRGAINEALDQGWSFGGNNKYEKELAKLVCERFQPTMELVRFTNSGTEANMMAVATAMAWTGKKKILVFEGGYHGATLSFRAAPVGLTTKSVNLPHEWVIGIYNDIAKTQAVLSTIPADSLAAILIEPMLGSAGAIPGSLPFLQFLRYYASSHNALLIFDEVMTSRLSYRGLGHKLGIRPDMMTLGKWVGGGMSFGAFGGRADVMALFDPTKQGSLAHAGTFNNNVVSMAAGCAGCKILNEETTDRLNELGETMKEKVQDTIDQVLNAHSQKRLDLQNDSSKGIPFHPHSSPYLKDCNSRIPGTSEIPSRHTLEDLQISSKDTEFSHGLATPGNSPSRTPATKTPTAAAMYISGIGSILAIHLPSSKLQSLFYHHMLSKGIYLAERGFMALNIKFGKEEVEKFVTATGDFVEKYSELILGC